MLEAGEMILVPRGVEHRSVAEEEAQVAIIHPASTVVPSIPQQKTL
jgi:quercetin dioxygenase-like cupin family protein